jgi:cobalt/nickel transport system permease protein
MDLDFFKSVGILDTPLRRLDGRVKTVFFLFGIIVAAVVSHWYLAAALWVAALAIFSTLRLPWRLLALRLLIPFGVAWLVFLTLLFTNGSHPLLTLLGKPFPLVIYSEGIWRGILIMLRILAAVTLACVLSCSTPMVEILETLRICKLPGIMVDIADMMCRYVFIMAEVARNMSYAQMCRTVRRLSWMEQVRNVGRVAMHVISKSLDRSTKIHHAMLSRGYSEENTAPVYFTGPVRSRDLRLGLLVTALLLMVLTINYLI